MKKNIINALFAVMIMMMMTLSLKTTDHVSAVSGYAAYVDPFIGIYTDNGKCAPGAVLPGGLIIAGPHNKDGNFEDSGYRYPLTPIQYFMHNTSSGSTTGWGYHCVKIMPATGNANIGATSSFTHTNETATPGYYQVKLDTFNINCEMTVTNRCAIHRYTFPQSTTVRILLPNLNIVQVSNTEIKGYDQDYTGTKFTEYYHMVFSKPFTSFVPVSGGAYVTYSTTANEQILVRIGCSYTNEAKAKLNLDTELPNFNFDTVKANAENIWNSYLGRIEVTGGTTQNLKDFYTGIYHALTGIRIMSDVDGSYPKRGVEPHVVLNTGGVWTKYTLLSMWDTYRAQQPLLDMVYPEIGQDVARSNIQDFLDTGTIHNWLAGDLNTDCMESQNEQPIILDAYINGLNVGNTDDMLNALKRVGKRDSFYAANGFLNCKTEGERGASLMFCWTYEDWCVAMAAYKKGDLATYNTYITRAYYYHNQLDPATKWMRPRLDDGSWWSQSGSWDPSMPNFFQEGDSYKYTWVFHDIQGIINRMGGDTAAVQKIDAIFNGHYAHSNEPSHHLGYLYNFVGQPSKTQYQVRKIMREKYNGYLGGDDDLGQMSAWYVYSALGFYPFCPGSGQYVIGSPQFNTAVIHMPGGKNFTITANNASDTNVYVQNVTLNSASYNKCFINFTDIAAGGNMVFNMGATPSNWGSTTRPYSLSPVGATPPPPPTPAPTPAGGTVAWLYQDGNYAGAVAAFTVGEFYTSDIFAKGGGDDWASSIKVTNGYKVTLYDNDYCIGTSIVKTADDANLSDDGFNDRVSSIKVESSSATSTPTPTPLPGGTDLCSGGTVSASGENAPNETKEKAFDDLTSSKWLVFADLGWIQYDFAGENAYAVNQYTITSANDSPERDPKNWYLKGSNDGSTWTTLDTRSGEVFSSRFQKKTYSFSNGAAYKIYRLDITSNYDPATANSTQLSEIEMFGTGGPVPTPTPTPGSTATPTPTSTPGSTNIALNKTATANGSQAGETPNLAVDGNSGWPSKWCYAAAGDKWLRLDLGTNYNIGRWVVKHAGCGENPNGNTKDFKLQKSTDGNTWTDVDSVTGNTANITDRNVTTFNTRYVRLYITIPTQTTDNAARIYELELY